MKRTVDGWLERSIDPQLLQHVVAVKFEEVFVEDVYSLPEYTLVSVYVPSSSEAAYLISSTCQLSYVLGRQPPTIREEC